MRAILIEQAIGNWLIRDYRQRTLRIAITWSYRAFVQQNRHWEEQLFNEHFLTHGAAKLLGRYVEGHAPHPAELAEAWADQFYLSAEKRSEFLTQLTPVAAQFLLLLEVELRRLWGAGESVSPTGISLLARG